MQQGKEGKQQQQPPLPPASHVVHQSTATSSTSSSSTDTIPPQLQPTCRGGCSSPALPACSYGRCTACCRQLSLYCPAHESRTSLVGARFAGVLDGSVSGGLRLTAQLGDRIYRGVLFTGPAAVRIQQTRSSVAAEAAGGADSSTGQSEGGGDAQQQSQPAAKRHKPTSANSAAVNVTSLTSAPAAQPANNSAHRPP